MKAELSNSNVEYLMSKQYLIPEWSKQQLKGFRLVNFDILILFRISILDIRYCSARSAGRGAGLESLHE